MSPLSSNPDPKLVFQKILRILAMGVFGLLLVVALFDSWYQLDARNGEHAVVQRFGRFTQEVTDPGIHWKLPFGMEKVTIERVQEVKRVEIGFRTTGHRDSNEEPVTGPESVAEAEHSIAITKDQNLIDADYVVQYEISSLPDYLFSSTHPEWTVRQAAKAVMREIIGNRNIDDIFLTARDEMQQEAKDSLQHVLDAYKVGVRIKSIQFQDVHAPKEVISAFDDVQKAREERETAVNEGKRLSNAIIPKAEGQAKRLTTEAEAYKIRRINEASGDASRFLSLYESYARNKPLARMQLYLQAMAEILPGLEKTILDGEGSTMLLPAAGKGR